MRSDEGIQGCPAFYAHSACRWALCAAGGRHFKVFAVAFAHLVAFSCAEGLRDNDDQVRLSCLQAPDRDELGRLGFPSGAQTPGALGKRRPHEPVAWNWICSFLKERGIHKRRMCPSRLPTRVDCGSVSH